MQVNIILRSFHLHDLLAVSPASFSVHCGFEKSKGALSSNCDVSTSEHNPSDHTEAKCWFSHQNSPNTSMLLAMGAACILKINV